MARSSLAEPEQDLKEMDLLPCMHVMFDNVQTSVQWQYDFNIEIASNTVFHDIITIQSLL